MQSSFLLSKLPMPSTGSVSNTSFSNTNNRTIFKTEPSIMQTQQQQNLQMRSQSSPYFHQPQLNSRLNSSLTNSGGLNASQSTQYLSGAGLDENSLKDIIEVLNKQINQTKSLPEFSQVLQIPNISTLSFFSIFFLTFFSE
jgi:hypothetical protein